MITIGPGRAQPADSDLTAIATLSPTDGSFLVRQSGTWTGHIASQARTDLGLDRDQPWGNTVVLLGNSRLELETYNSGAYRQLRGIFTWANRFLGHRLRIVHYAGLGGNKLTDMITRWSADVGAYTPTIVVIADAVNDISNGATLAAVQASYQTLITNNRSIRARTILLTNNPNSAHTTGQAAILAQTNQWLRSLTDPDLLVIDVTSPIASSSSLAWATNMSTDGLHQSRVGAARIGRAVANVLDPLIPRTDPLPLYTGAATELVPNPFMAGTVGTGVPANWTVFPAASGSLVYSLVARTDQKPGNWFQVDTTAASADTFIATNFLALSGIASTGDYVEAVIEMQSDAWTSVSGAVRLSLQLADGSNNVITEVADGQYVSTTQEGDTGDATAYPLENQPGIGASAVYRTPRVQVTSSTTQAKLLFETNFQGKARFSRASIRKAL